MSQDMLLQSGGALPVITGSATGTVGVSGRGYGSVIKITETAPAPDRGAVSGLTGTADAPSARLLTAGDRRGVVIGAAKS